MYGSKPIFCQHGEACEVAGFYGMIGGDRTAPGAVADMMMVSMVSQPACMTGVTCRGWRKTWRQMGERIASRRGGG